jgi:hypothetical protein
MSPEVDRDFKINEVDRDFKINEVDRDFKINEVDRDFKINEVDRDFKSPILYKSSYNTITLFKTEHALTLCVFQKNNGVFKKKKISFIICSPKDGVFYQNLPHNGRWGELWLMIVNFDPYRMFTFLSPLGESTPNPSLNEQTGLKHFVQIKDDIFLISIVIGGCVLKTEQKREQWVSSSGSTYPLELILLIRFVRKFQ